MFDSFLGLECHVDTKHIGLGPRIETTVGVVIAVERSLGVNILGVFLQRRPVTEVFTREIDTHLVNVSLLGDICRNRITYGQVLETEVTDILDVTAFANGRGK